MCCFLGGEDRPKYGLDMIRLVTALVLLVAIQLPTVGAEARAANTYRYPFEQLWGATVRLLRVDYGFTIRDRDRDIGYVLFDYQEQGRTVPGSVEFIRGEEGVGAETRVTIQIPAMPSYISQMVLQRLNRKLRTDFGEPPRRERRPEPSPSEPEGEPEGSEPSDGSESS